MMGLSVLFLVCDVNKRTVRNKPNEKNERTNEQKKELEKSHIHSKTQPNCA